MICLILTPQVTDLQDTFEAYILVVFKTLIKKPEAKGLCQKHHFLKRKGEATLLFFTPAIAHRHGHKNPLR